MTADRVAGRDPVDRIRRVVRILQEIDDPDAIAHAETLRLVLAGAGFEAAAALPSRWRESQRERAIVAALAIIAGSMRPASARAMAATIQRLLRAYETRGSWRTDSAKGRRPSGRTGLLFDYLTAGGPASAERIRRRFPWVAETSTVTHEAS